jgi:hypothetical protein
MNTTIVSILSLRPTLDHMYRETRPYQFLQPVDPNNTTSNGLKLTRRVENKHNLATKVDDQQPEMRTLFDTHRHKETTQHPRRNRFRTAVFQ